MDSASSSTTTSGSAKSSNLALAEMVARLFSDADTVAEAWSEEELAKRESSDESGDERRNDPSNGKKLNSDDKEEEEEEEEDDDDDDVAMKTKYGDSPMAGVSLQSGGLHGEVAQPVLITGRDHLRRMI